MVEAVLVRKTFWLNHAGLTALWGICTRFRKMTFREVEQFSQSRTAGWQHGKKQNSGQVTDL